MSLRTSLLPVFGKIRALTDRLGLSLYSLTIRTTIWSGERVGVGTRTHTDIAIATDAMQAERVSSRDIVASGGLYADGDFAVKLTPEYDAGGITGGITIATFDPPVSSAPTEISFLLKGPGLPDEGAWCDKIDQRTSEPFEYTLILRRRGTR